MHGWTPPAPLNMPVPRRVGLTTQWEFFCGFMVMSWIVAAFAVLWALPLGNPFWSTGTSAVVVLVFVSIFGSQFGVIYFLYAREMKLLKFGRLAPAKIIAEAEYTVKGQRYAKLTYSFTDNDGNLIRGERSSVPTHDQTRASLVERRARIFENPTAIFNPEKSSRNMLYPPVIAKIL